MHAGRNYSLWQTIHWTRKNIYIFIVLSLFPVILYDWFGFRWINIPWLPIALVGTAVAFYLGFKNNSSYERLWEARKIWGAIVNTSRTWGVLSKDYVSNIFTKEKVSEVELKSIHQQLTYRHLAWLTALRYQLRTPRAWEHNNPTDKAMRKEFGIEEISNLENELKIYLPDEEVKNLMNKKNIATHILKNQSEELRKLREQHLIDDFRHMEMGNRISELYDHQGKSERIKNFPFPRQYASVNLFFVWLFIILVPFGMVNEFRKFGEGYIWGSIPFSILVCWVFHTMEMIGDYSENPFEGLFNDVPITDISKAIEVDLREMLGETELPERCAPKTGYTIIL